MMVETKIQATVMMVRSSFGSMLPNLWLHLDGVLPSSRRMAAILSSEAA